MPPGVITFIVVIASTIIIIIIITIIIIVITLVLTLHYDVVCVCDQSEGCAVSTDHQQADIVPAVCVPQNAKSRACCVVRATDVTTRHGKTSRLHVSERDRESLF